MAMPRKRLDAIMSIKVPGKDSKGPSLPPPDDEDDDLGMEHGSDDSYDGPGDAGSDDDQDSPMTEDAGPSDHSDEERSVAGDLMKAFDDHSVEGVCDALKAWDDAKGLGSVDKDDSDPRDDEPLGGSPLRGRSGGY